MRVTFIAISAIIAITITPGVVETRWRLQHPLSEPATFSPSGEQVAEVRSMPEGSAVPYGTGVFLQTHWLSLKSINAELVFGGYCLTTQLAWPTDKTLRINCAVHNEEKNESKLFKSYFCGTTIEASISSQAGGKSNSRELLSPDPHTTHRAGLQWAEPGHKPS